MRKLKVIGFVLRETGADRIIAGFLAFMLVCATVIALIEPGIHTWGEALWYCFTVVSTIGFGDIVVHTLLSRALSVLLSVYAVVTVAIFTGVIVNAFNRVVELRQQESITAIVDKLDRLPEMSKEELTQLSLQIKKKIGEKNRMIYLGSAPFFFATLS